MGTLQSHPPPALRHVAGSAGPTAVPLSMIHVWIGTSFSYLLVSKLQTMLRYSLYWSSYKMFRVTVFNPFCFTFQSGITNNYMPSAFFFFFPFFLSSFPLCIQILFFITYVQNSIVIVCIQFRTVLFKSPQKRGDA